MDFILNDYRVIVAWNHPRFAYQKFIESEARKNISHLDVNMDDMFNLTTPDYVKAGQSRKIIKSYTINKFPEEFANWSQAYKLALQEITHSVMYQVKPFIKTQWLANGYLIKICAPIEVLSVEGLVQLVNIVKRLLKGETNLNREFPDYIYTKEQWLIELGNSN